MKHYLVTYKGDYLGGNAVVVASSKEEAIELARVHRDTWKFSNVEVKELESIGVIYNDCGDY